MNNSHLNTEKSTKHSKIISNIAATLGQNEYPEESTMLASASKTTREPWMIEKNKMMYLKDLRELSDKLYMRLDPANARDSGLLKQHAINLFESLRNLFTPDEVPNYFIHDLCDFFGKGYYKEEDWRKRYGEYKPTKLFDDTLYLIDTLTITEYDKEKWKNKLKTKEVSFFKKIINELKSNPFKTKSDSLKTGGKVKKTKRKSSNQRKTSKLRKYGRKK